MRSLGRGGVVDRVEDGLAAAGEQGLGEPGTQGRGLGCRRVGVQLVYTDGLTVVRQATSTLPVDDDCALEQLARTALYRAWHRRTRLRSLALCCDRLLHPVRQLSLFAPADPGRERQRSLSAAMDAIRVRCGDTAILRGSRRTPDAPTAAA